MRKVYFNDEYYEIKSIHVANEVRELIDAQQSGVDESIVNDRLKFLCNTIREKIGINKLLHLAINNKKDYITGAFVLDIEATKDNFLKVEFDEDGRQFAYVEDSK